jgi:hypothetical protein
MFFHNFTEGTNVLFLDVVDNAIVDGELIHPDF